MHHVVVERWSRGASPLHSRDARAKIGAALVLLILIATTPARSMWAFAAYFALVLVAVAASRLPALSLLARAGAVLPFSAVFALVTWIGGDPVRAAALVIRSYVSAAAVLLLVSTTRLPDLLRAVEWYRVPRLLVLIAQFLYRYLFVLSEQAQHMRLAAACRTAQGARRRSVFNAAAGALSVLFARSYARADGIHRAMLSRGFTGHFPGVAAAPAGVADWVFLLAAVAASSAIRAAA